MENIVRSTCRGEAAPSTTGLGHKAWEHAGIGWLQWPDGRHVIFEAPVKLFPFVQLEKWHLKYYLMTLLGRRAKVGVLRLSFLTSELLHAICFIMDK